MNKRKLLGFVAVVTGFVWSQAALANSSEAFDACSANFTPSAVASELEALGWEVVLGDDPIDASISLRERTRLRDGVIAAMSTDNTTPIDWKTASQTAADLVRGITRTNRTRFPGHDYLLTNSGTEAIVFVLFVGREGNFETFRCMYGGPFSDATRTLIESQLSGLNQANPTQATSGLVINEFQIDGGHLGRRSVVSVRFGEVVNDETIGLLRPLSVELGFSLVHAFSVR